MSSALSIKDISVKRGNPISGTAIETQLECSGSLPAIPQALDVTGGYTTLLELCSESSPKPNMDCQCAETPAGRSYMICANSQNGDVQDVINYCYQNCDCGEGAFKWVYSEQTGKLSNWQPQMSFWINEQIPIPSPFQTMQEVCGTTCTSVNRQCSQGAGTCTCYAPPLGLFFWAKGDCGPSKLFAETLLTQISNVAIIGKKKRDDTTYSIGKLHSSTINSLAATISEAEQVFLSRIVDGKLPSPCNASYVSYACTNSTDGIVYEDPKNWLGELLPDNATSIPPIPQSFLTLSGIPGAINENESQVEAQARDLTS